MKKRSSPKNREDKNVGTLFLSNLCHSIANHINDPHGVCRVAVEKSEERSRCKQ